MKNVQKQLNDRTYTHYFYYLMLIARSVFKWNNLPNGIDEKWIERFLFTHGNCLFFKDKTKGYMVAKCTPSDNLNAYDEPTGLRPYGTNYDGESLTNYKDCVLIRNNDIMLPTAPAIQLFAYRLAETTRTIDTNIAQQKTPVIVTCSDKQKLSMTKVIKQRDTNEIVIYGDKSLDTDSIKVLKTDAPVVFDKLQLQKHAIWNECMTFLGINNANQDKKERLVDDEVQANNEQVDASINLMLKSREQACDMINELYEDLDISVEIRTDLKPTLDGIEDIKDGDEDDR